MAALQSGFSQDIILQGCYWSCPEDDPNEPIDSASLSYWTERMREQAPELAYAGFTYLWLPPLQDAPPDILKPFFEGLTGEGIVPLASIYLQRAPDFLERARTLKKTYGIQAFSLHQARAEDVPKVSAAINQLFLEGSPLSLLVADLGQNTTANQLNKWVSQAASQLNFEAELEAQPRIYDFPLRESLRRACTDPEYDVRQVFDRSMRDASALSGFNVVTFINHPTFKNQNGQPGDQDDPLESPLLAYAYLLANNQIGLPAVFYGDFYGSQSEVEGYEQAPPLKEAISQLIRAHQDFIYGSTSIEYLNEKGSSKQAVYPGDEPRADSSDVLIFQLDGSSTPAGKNNTPPGDKEVLVAINFSKDTLEVLQEINLAHVQPDDYFTDIIGNALEETSYLTTLDSNELERNAITIRLPPRSYSIWVQGRAVEVIPSRIELQARGVDKYVEISWESAYESNLMGYELERSVDGGTFKAIASMQAVSGSSDPASYIFLDEDVYPGERLFYRVKALDKSGGYEYSPVEQAAIFQRKLTFELLDDKQGIEKYLIIQSNSSANASIHLINAQGELAFSQLQPIQKGKNRATIPTAQLEKGVYFLHFNIGEKQWWSRRLVKF